MDFSLDSMVWPRVATSLTPAMKIPHGEAVGIVG
eukprot:CAMPEP_0117606594 /NCGR_PEP_ID=MMETSP0784-20121206/79791_1 /TAXON_ID=39447 /ORGANISM="" /LENGTH=33 /DNA_ID= /DNA_START= /DNA_END= /DNA_ORIENTATION=